jgi:hypothetical protein
MIIQWLFQADHIAPIAAMIAAAAAIIAIIFVRRSIRIRSEIDLLLRD